MTTADNLLGALGVPDEAIERLRRIQEVLHEPTEEDVAAIVWAVELEIADDRMVPESIERMNGVVVPRQSTREEDSYRLQPSRIKRGTGALVLSLGDARVARARYLLWHSYYVRAYHAGRLSFIERDAARRLYWQGNDPPPDPEHMLVDFEIRRAVQDAARPRKRSIP